MGGKAGSVGLNPKQLKNLEQQAKKSLQEGDSGNKSNVFISFTSDDIDEVNLLRGQAKNENSNIQFNDWSLKEPYDSEKAEYIKRGIRERIRQCSVTIIYLTDKTADSKWVDWEIRESIAMGKGVIAMHKGDTPPKRLPNAITNNRIQIVPWNQNQLAKAIQKKSESR